MSATSFLRHRRSAAVALIVENLSGPRADDVLEVLAGYNLSPEDVGNLAGNTDVLTIADAVAAKLLDQPELDDLETLGVLELGDRAAVHGSGVQARQFEPRIQHPCQETVGVGNMHDIAAVAAESLANVSQQEVIDADGSIADAAEAKADDALANHDGLPPAAPTPNSATGSEPPVPGAGDDESGRTSQPPTPVGENAEGADQAAAETPTDPEGDNTGAETKVDLVGAAAVLGDREKDEAALEKLGEDAILAMNREQLLDYAGKFGLTDKLEFGARTYDATIAKQIVKLQEESTNG